MHHVEVALLGDSIVAQMAPRQAGFPAPFISAKNLGVSGETTAQILARVGSIPSTVTHVILAAGTNDLLGLGTDAGIISGYTSILNAIPSTTTVIVFGILPVDESTMRSDWVPYLNNAKIHQQNVLISNLCRTYSNCVVATGIMAKNMNGKTVDGIHPASADVNMEFIKLLMPLLGL
jgi:lysophospholipase L1-like esterase